jgi:FlaG/FlaF family flagellin (archaellin)
MEVNNRSMKTKTRKAVAPVLATLLMIAVAVSMSVIIFMWGQGFLSQTSEGTGAQQGAQNQAAQSSVAIEAVLFNPNATSNTATISIIVRNVGAVAIKLGAVSITGLSANAEMTGNVLGTLSDSTWTVTGSDDSGNQSWSASGGTSTLSKGEAATIVFTRTDDTGEADDTWFDSGDVITIKVTTTVGTFAQASYTVP